MSSEAKRRLTVQEYLIRERRSPSRSELVDGELFAMTGASRRHNLAVVNVAAALHAQLGSRDCEVYASDMRVRVPATNLFTYPDVTVVCGQPRFDDAELDTLLNPVLIVEVLSRTTEDYDRGTKFANYRTLESLAEYLLLAQDEPHAEHFVRQAGGAWLLTEATRIEEVIELPSIGCRLALADVYRKVLAPPTA